MGNNSEEVYGPDRAERLLAMLRALAERIQALDRTGELLERVPELQKLLRNARSERFHYEVRSTYDTPEVAESRRIVDEAELQTGEVGGGRGEGGCRMRRRTTSRGGKQAEREGSLKTNERILRAARGGGGDRRRRPVVQLAATGRAGPGAERAASRRRRGRVPRLHDGLRCGPD